MFFKKIKESRAIKEDMNLDQKIRSQYSEWSNNLQKKSDIFVFYTSEPRNEKPKSFPVFDLIYRVIKPLTLSAYEYIYKYCPEAKANIDRLVSGANYDLDKVREAIVSYGLGLFRYAKYLHDNNDMTPDGIGNFVLHMKTDSAGRQRIADESSVILDDFKRHRRAELNKGNVDPAIFYISFIVALSGMSMDEIFKKPSPLTSSMAEDYFLHYSVGAIKTMVEAMDEPFWQAMANLGIV